MILDRKRRKTKETAAGTTIHSQIIVWSTIRAQDKMRSKDGRKYDLWSMKVFEVV